MNGGATSLDNLSSYAAAIIGLSTKADSRYRIRINDGQVRFLRPNGRILEAAPATPVVPWPVERER